MALSITFSLFVWFLLQIEAIDREEGEVKVQFLKRHHSGQYYTWPEIPDESWVKLDQISRAMANPWIDARNHFTFQD